MASKLKTPAPIYIIPTEKNHAGLRVIAPIKENKNVAKKNEVKSLSNAFCASLLSSPKMKPKSAAALTGVKIHSSVKPNIKYAYNTPRNLIMNV